jgi:hypothetical protein
MDATGLPALFSQGNPFLAQMGEQEWKQGQERKQADLATLVGAEQRAQAMHPLQMENQRATTRLNASTAAMNEDTLQAKPPVADRLAEAIAKSRQGKTDAQLAVEDATMYRRMQHAAMAQANGGVMPLNIMSQLDEEERQYFANPKATAITMKVLKAWHDAHPKVMEAARRDAADLAQIQARPQPGGGSKESTATKTDDTAIKANILKLRADPPKVLGYMKAIWDDLTEEQKARWRPVVKMAREQANADANKGAANKPDVGAATKGQVPMNPAVDLGGVNETTGGRPARQAGTKQITIYKDGKAVGTIPENERAEAIKQGYTVK